MKSSIRLLLFCFFITSVTGCTAPGAVRFAAIGDTPYFESDSELAVVSSALDKMDKADIPFVIHIGDIIRSGTSCSRKLFEQRGNIFAKSPIPFMITIGDNEFVDCKNNFAARRLFRDVILKDPPVSQTITGTNEDVEPLNVTRQNSMIENVTWSYKDVGFIMLVFPDFPGNYALKSSEINKILRNNIKFLIENLNRAKKNNYKAVVIAMHSSPVTCGLDICFEFSKVFRREIISFAKPVLLINGSNHENKFVKAGYMGVSNLWHLRPGSEPGELWPEIMFSPASNKFKVKWHVEPDVMLE